MKLMRVGSQIVELRARASPGSYIFPVAKTQGYVAAIVLCEYILAVDRGRNRGEKRRAIYTIGRLSLCKTESEQTGESRLQIKKPETLCLLKGPVKTCRP